MLAACVLERRAGAMRDRPATVTPQTGALDVEEGLRSELEGVRLVAEIGVSEARYHELTALVIGLTHGVSDPPARMAARYPAIYVTYLVAAGIYSYEGGSFWPHVVKALQDPQNDPGYRCLYALRELGVETFDTLVSEDNATRYVSRILVHGGIPAHCLDEFFAMLVADTRGVAADASELLASWRTRRARLDYLHKPARRFLLYGGGLAVDLLDRCIDLVEESSRTGRVPDANEVGLPPYVVEAFAKRPRAGTKVGRSPRRAAFSRARLVLDPYDGLGPTIELPPLPASDSTGTWVVNDGTTTREHPTSAVGPMSVRLAPSTSWEVEFRAADGSARKSTFEGLDRVPALFIDPSTGAALRDPNLIALDTVWALLPETWQLKGLEGELREIEELPAPTGSWSGFRLVHVDLEGVKALVLSDQTTEATRRVSVATPKARPLLQGHVVPGVMTEDGCPVYDAMPRVSVPTLEGVKPERWQFRVRADGGVRAFTDEVGAERGEVDLAAHAHIEDDSLGVYDLRARGPLGSDLQARFAVVSGLRVKRPARVQLPTDGEPQVSARADDRIVIRGEDGSEQLSLSGAEDLMACSAETDAGGRLAFSIRIPRLIWGITHDTKPAVAPAAEVLKVGAEEFEDHLADVLTIRTGKPGTPLQLMLRCGTRIVKSLDICEAAGIDGRWSFDLEPFAETIRTSDEAGLAFYLGVEGRDVRLAQIVPNIDVRAITADSRVADDFTSVIVHFKQERMIRGRCVHLWSLHRPWEGPTTEPVPDDLWEVEVAGLERVPAGPYLAEIGILDDWVGPRRPALGALNTGQISVGSRDDLEERLQELSTMGEKGWVELAVAGQVLSETESGLTPAISARAALALGFLLRDMPPGASASASFQGARRLATASAGGLLRGIVDAVTSGQIEVEETARISMRTVGRTWELEPPSDAGLLEDAWSVCPVLAARFDVRASETDQPAAERCDRFLGSSGDDLRLDSSGGRVSQVEAGRSAAELRAMKRFLALVPTRPLDSEALVIANFEWLCAQKLAEEGELTLDKRPSEWVTRYGMLLESASSTEEFSGASDLALHVEAREPTPGAFAFAALPQIALVAAAHLVYRSPLSKVGRNALEEAMAFAPRLVEHDLLLATVLASSAPAEIAC